MHRGDRYQYIFNKNDLLHLQIESQTLNDQFILKGNPKADIGLINDIARGSLMVMGVNFSKQKEYKELGLFSEKQAAVYDFLKKHLNNHAQLKNHYVQEVLKLIPEILMGIFAKQNRSIVITNPEKQVNNLFEIANNTYIRTCQQNFGLVEINENGMPNLPSKKIIGPVETLFKLTNVGFELISIRTNDKKLYDLINNHIQTAPHLTMKWP